MTILLFILFFRSLYFQLFIGIAFLFSYFLILFIRTTTKSRIKLYLFEWCKRTIEVVYSVVSIFLFDWNFRVEIVRHKSKSKSNQLLKSNLKFTRINIVSAERCFFFLSFFLQGVPNRSPNSVYHSNGISS